jgi:hypothetical protein
LSTVVSEPPPRMIPPLAVAMLPFPTTVLFTMSTRSALG